MTPLLEYLQANPLVLLPVLLLAAVAIYAAIKKLLKLVMILLIAGILYVLLLQYLGG